MYLASSLFVLAAWLKISCAQSSTAISLPACADSCVVSGTPASCSLDPACICSARAFTDAIACCASAACDTADYEETEAYAQEICNPLGVTLVLGTCTTGTSSSVNLGSIANSVICIIGGTGSACASATANSAASSTASVVSSPASMASAALTSKLSSSTSSNLIPSSSSSSSSIPTHRTSTGLSTGAIAGIGVAGGLAAIGFILLGFCLGRRRSKRKHTQEVDHAPVEGKNAKHPVTSGGSTTNPKDVAPYELPGKPEPGLAAVPLSKQTTEIGSSQISDQPISPMYGLDGSPLYARDDLYEVGGLGVEDGPHRSVPQEAVGYARYETDGNARVETDGATRYEADGTPMYETDGNVRHEK